MTKPTQLAAWDAMQPVLPPQHAAVLALLRLSGRTAAEVAVHLKCSANQAAARLTELAERGRVRDSGTTRVNANTNRKNIVWVICDPPLAPIKPPSRGIDEQRLARALRTHLSAIAGMQWDLLARKIIRSYEADGQ